MDIATIVSIVIMVVVLALIAGLIALSYGIAKANAKREAAKEEAPAEEPAEQPAEEAAEEPVAEPVAEEPAEEPVAEPVAEEPAEEPVAEEPAEEPVAEEPAEEPVAEEAAEQPAEEPAEQPAEEPAEEPVEEPAEEEVAAAIAPAAEEEPAPVEEKPAPVAKEAPAPVAAGDVAGERLIVKEMSPALREALGVVGAEHDEEVYSVRYSYSFKARLVLSGEEIKSYYSELVAELATYKKMRRRMSRRQQNVSVARNRVAVILFKGKKLCLALALDPKNYEGTKYRGKDVSAMKRFASTPMLVKVDSPRKLKYAKYLLAQLAEANGLQQGKGAPAAEEVPALTREQLIAEKEIKVSGKRVEPEA